MRSTCLLTRRLVEGAGRPGRDGCDPSVKTPRSSLTFYTKASYFSPPCGLGPRPWRPCLGWGSGAPPFCFPLFSLFFPGLVGKSRWSSCFGESCCGHPFWLKPLRFDCAIVRKSVAGSYPGALLEKHLDTRQLPLRTPPPQSQQNFGRK